MKWLLLIPSSLVLFACGRGGVTIPGSEPTNSTPPVVASEVRGAQPVQGTINGGGGVGLRCGSKLEMLDLYEARQSGYKPATMPLSSDEAASFVSSRIAKHFWNVETISPVEHERAIKQDIVLPIFEGRAFHNRDTGKMEDVRFVESLPLSNDFGKYQLPDGCALEQIAFFSDTNTQLSIVQSAWNDLDLMSKSVLVAHELLYMMNRRNGLEKLMPKGDARTSESARVFVGRLLSLESLPAKSNGVLGQEKLFRCSSSDVNGFNRTYFYAFDDSRSQRLTLIFNSLRGASGLYQVRAVLTSGKLEQLIEKVQALSEESVEIESVGSKQKTKLAIRIRKNPGEATELVVESITGNRGVPIGSPQWITCDRI